MSVESHQSHCTSPNDCLNHISRSASLNGRMTKIPFSIRVVEYSRKQHHRVSYLYWSEKLVTVTDFNTLLPEKYSLYFKDTITCIHFSKNDSTISQNSLNCVAHNPVISLSPLVYFGCQLDKPYGFPDDQQQNASIFQCHVNTGIDKMFFYSCITVASVGNKTYYCYHNLMLVMAWRSVRAKLLAEPIITQINDAVCSQ